MEGQMTNEWMMDGLYHGFCISMLQNS